MCILRDVPVRRANSRVVGVNSVVALREVSNDSTSEDSN